MSNFMKKYILDGKIPKECDDVVEWGRFMEEGNRVVESTHIGDVHISTVFLGLNHSWVPGPPILFETMIFGGEHDEYQERYSDWNSALIGHAYAVSIVKGETETPPREYPLIGRKLRVKRDDSKD